MHNISVLGTSSDSGKSTLTFLIGRILQELGYSVAPFKAQNVSNNAKVADDGSEISIAQFFQAEVLKVPTSFHLNPVLLKSGQDSSSSLIVNGKVIANKDVREYYRQLDLLKPSVNKAFEYLDARYDCVIAEGAGSPVELNLMNKDLANIYVASKFKTKIILVADIEKGGVFASIYGVYNLLPAELRQNVIGVIVNKFRGDMTLFNEGVKIIEEQFNIPVLGVLPYKVLNVGFEDSQSLKNYQQVILPNSRRVAVIAYPTMSNYNDLEPLISDDNIALEFITANTPLNNFDEIILPGSKLVLKDLEWLKTTGLFQQILTTKSKITGICGGYQMMFKSIVDENGVESNTFKANGLGFINDEIIFQTKKILKRGKYRIFGNDFTGFEMHHGISTKFPIFYEKDRIRGTFVHGVFDDAEFIIRKEKCINDFVQDLKQYIDIERLVKYVR